MQKSLNLPVTPCSIINVHGLHIPLLLYSHIVLLYCSRAPEWITKSISESSPASCHDWIWKVNTCWLCWLRHSQNQLPILSWVRWLHCEWAHSNMSACYSSQACIFFAVFNIRGMNFPGMPFTAAGQWEGSYYHHRLAISNVHSPCEDKSNLMAFCRYGQLHAMVQAAAAKPTRSFLLFKVLLSL